MKKSAFTLIELLVVIVIIGILSSIGISKFRNYQAKARDSERKFMLNQVYKIITNTDVASNSDEKYLVKRDDLVNYFAEHQYESLSNRGNYCFIYLSNQTSKLSFSNTNDFIIATWGETTSTNNTETSGLLYKGTDLSAKKMGNFLPNWENSFLCSNWENINSTNYWSGPSSNYTFRHNYFNYTVNSVPPFWNSTDRPLHTEMVFVINPSTGNPGIVCRDQSGKSVAQSCADL